MAFNLEIHEDKIPALSSVALEALDELRSEDATNERLERIINRDPGLTSRVLLIANAPFYAGRAQSRTVSDAIRRLGLRQLRNVIVAAAAGELFDSQDPIVASIWEHSLQTAQLAQLLVQHLRLPGCQDAYVAGLLHDIGIIILYQQCPELFSHLHDAETGEWCRLLGFEMQLDDYLDHNVIGGLVVRKWALPSAIADVVRFHHNIDDAIPEMIENDSLVCVVAFSDQLSQALMCGREMSDWVASRSETAFWMQLKMTQSVTERFLSLAHERNVLVAV